MAAEVSIEYTPVPLPVELNTPEPPPLTLAKKLTRAPGGYVNGPMANWEQNTWSTQSVHIEPDIRYGILSYSVEDGSENGIPVRLFGDAALRALGRKA